jgi:hypothetical protein
MAYFFAEKGAGNIEGLSIVPMSIKEILGIEETA